MSNITTVGVIGSGYVGLTTAAIFANAGFKVYAIEINPERLASIQRGKSFFYEVGIDPLLATALDTKRLVATGSYEAAIPACDIVFSCVGTPDNPDGSSNLSYVFDAAQTAAGFLRSGSIFVQKSTVPVGTGEKIETLFEEAGKHIRYVSNPEFLREGTAISDTLWFDRIVTGSNDSTAADEVADMYRAMELQRDTIARTAGIAAPATTAAGSYVTTSRNSAELIKVTANAFLSLKISFANSIAKLADQAGADVGEVMDAVGADRRIGRAFLNAGRGYGGGCFPKDVSGLIRSAEDYGVNMEIMLAASDVNASMPHYIIAKTAETLGEMLKGKKVAVFGLAFKPGTSDTRRSPAVAIANTLADEGAEVKAYDPEAMAEAQPELQPGVTLCSSATAAAAAADVIFVATDWPEFKTFDYKNTKAVIVDCMNTLDAAAIKQAGLTYIGVGRR